MIAVHSQSRTVLIFPVSAVRCAMAEPGRPVILCVDMGRRIIDIPLSSSVHAVREALDSGRGNLSAAGEVAGS